MDEQQRKLAEELLFSEEKKPSFAKQLYFGNIEASSLFPFPTQSKEEKQKDDEFLKEIKSFVETQIDPDAIDRNSEIPQSVIVGLAKLGILGMTIPKEYGGLGRSQALYCKCMEMIAARCGATAVFVNAHQSVGLKALLLFGTEEQKKKWLPPLAKGDMLAAFSLTEPNAGSDASGIETRAIYDPEKKVWRINGQKQWTTNGSIAGMLTVMARTEIETPQGKLDKITAFLVTPDMPGFEILNPGLEKVGIRGTKTTNLAFKNVEVPEANILGPLGGGLKVCLTVLDYGRTTFGATCTGVAKYLVKRAVEQAQNRYQFKRPIGSFSLVKKKIALMSAFTYAMESTTLLTAAFVDLEIEDFMLEAAMLKVFCSDSLWNILYDTMQIYGGRSFFTTEPFERMMRDARLNMIGEGSNEVMRAFIGVVGMRDVGMQLKGLLDSIKAPIKEFSVLKGHLQGWLTRVSLPLIPTKSEELQQLAIGLARRVRSFGMSVAKLLVRNREAILEKQLLLDRIATAGMSLYTASAVLSRIDRELQAVSGDVKSLGNDVAIAKLYCQVAFDTIDEALASLKDNIDSEIENLSDAITGIHLHERP